MVWWHVQRDWRANTAAFYSHQPKSSAAKSVLRFMPKNPPPRACLKQLQRVKRPEASGMIPTVRASQVWKTWNSCIIVIPNVHISLWTKQKVEWMQEKQVESNLLPEVPDDPTCWRQQLSMSLPKAANFYPFCAPLQGANAVLDKMWVHTVNMCKYTASILLFVRALQLPRLMPGWRSLHPKNPRESFLWHWRDGSAEHFPHTNNK